MKASPAPALLCSVLVSCWLLAAGCGGGGGSSGGTAPMPMGEPAPTGGSLEDLSPGSPSAATETNAVPAVCMDDEGCPDGVSCRFASSTDEVGFCDVGEATADAGL